jgi:diguanylate cyclase (GGDEF)-like protein
MNEDHHFLRECRMALDRLLAGELPDPVHYSDAVSPEVSALVNSCNALVSAFTSASPFLAALSEGNIEVEPPPRNQLIAPFKTLHANLRHLVWQTRQVAAGDLSQQVDFLGDFSKAFNSMIESLRQKQSIEELLTHLVSHDPLTGLHNRLYFNEELIRLEHGRQFPISIIVGDIDGLKELNDTCGHSAGDSLIKAAAAMLRAGVRSEDLVARLGGDEFGIILPRTDEETAQQLLRRLGNQDPAVTSPEGFTISISLGLATAEAAGEPLAETFKRADAQMYADKFSRNKQRGTSQALTARGLANTEHGFGGTTHHA